MIRNREIRLHLIGMAGLAATATLITAWIHPLSGLITAIFSAGMIVYTMLYSHRRYKDLEHLAGYLRKISNGNDQMDIRDNSEGELSILKSEIYKVTMMLSRQRDYLKKDKKRLADALSDISHQLKTPLTSMTVMTDLLSQSTLTEEKRTEFTKNIVRQLERMDWLLSALLTLSKIDAGTLEFKRNPVNVSKLIDEALKPLMIMIDIKDQSLDRVINESVELTGDFNWLREALVNILKNCIEHTPVSGRLSIHAEENPIYTEIIISDSGPGIHKEDLPYIFNRFYKGKHAGNDSIGIGLAMSRSIIESQNGTITAENSSHTGARFVIKLYKTKGD